MVLPPHVCAVSPRDFTRMVEVWEASVRATHHFLAEGDVETLRPLVQGFFTQAGSLACVRNREGQVAGFVGVTGESLDMLFIHPAYRGQGAGRLLVDYAVRLGARTLDVNEQNEQAVGFYRRMGFEVVGRSERDTMGKPYPLLHMRRRAEGSA